MVYTLIACQWFLALVFAVSAVSKLRGGRAFEGFVAAVRRLAPRWAISALRAPGRPVAGGRRLAVVIVAAETAIPVLLLVPGTGLAGFVIAGVLLMAFTMAITSVLRRGDRVACRCFGGSDQPLRPAHVVRNLALLAAAGAGAALTLAPPNTAVSLLGAVTAVATGVFTAFLVLLLDDLLDLFSPLNPRSTTAP